MKIRNKILCTTIVLLSASTVFGMEGAEKKKPHQQIQGHEGVVQQGEAIDDPDARAQQAAAAANGSEKQEEQKREEETPQPRLIQQFAPQEPHKKQPKTLEQKIDAEMKRIPGNVEKGVQKLGKKFGDIFNLGK